MNYINKKFNNLLKYKKEFVKAKPFPHFVMDNFLDTNFYNKINSDIEKINSHKFKNNKGKTYNTNVERNKWISKNIDLPINMKKLLGFLNSKSWIDNLSQLSGIESLVGTKILNSKISNFHAMSKNGFLGSHVDHSADPTTGNPHVMNIIIFLTKKWNVAFGGNTLFYNKHGTEVRKKIQYKANRAVIFLHTPFSFHGVSKIKKNKDLKRSTIYIDYFSKSLEPFSHLDLEFSNKWFLHDTCFKLNSFIEYLKPANLYYLKSNIKYKISKYIS